MVLTLHTVIRLDLSTLSLPTGAGVLLQSHPLLRAAGDGGTHVEEHNEIHYDTPSLQLYRHQIALSLLRRGEQWIQRCGDVSGPETKWVEIPVTEQQLELKPLRKIFVLPVLSWEEIRSLAPAFTVHCREQRWTLNIPGDLSLLLREERGYLKLGVTRQTFHELVFEYQSGSLARWYQTVLLLACHLFDQEKGGVPEKGGPGLLAATPVMRGFAWLDPALLLPVLPPPQEGAAASSGEEGTGEEGGSRVSTDMTTRQLFGQLAAELLQRMQDNHALVLFGGKQAKLEGVRLFYQAVSRLQTLLLLHKTMFPKNIFAELERETAWLAKELHLVLECQTLLRETLEPLLEQFATHSGLEELLLKTKNGLVLAIKRLEKALTSFRYARLLLGMANWATSNQWEFLADPEQRDLLEVPAGQFATDCLQLYHAQLRKQGRNWSEMDLAARCAMHVDVDLLVNTVDLFADLFANKRMKQATARNAFQEVLRRLQSRLQLLLHLHTGNRFLGRWVSTREGSGQPLIQEWQEARVRRQQLDATREWEQFSNKLSFWI
ncbi:MAG: CHAD domain-containing protein [Magnetococcus sp. YQC-3]